MPNIRCTVSNCEYWGQNNYCRADQILVTAPESPLQVADKHGVGAEQLRATPARNLQDTCCYTFDAKGQ